jgi:hypothetical protein
LLKKLHAYGKLFARTKYRRTPDLARLLWRRLALLAAVSTYEMALMVTSRVDSRLKALASIKTSALIGCPF